MPSSESDLVAVVGLDGSIVLPAIEVMARGFRRGDVVRVSLEADGRSFNELWGDDNDGQAARLTKPDGTPMTDEEIEALAVEAVRETRRQMNERNDNA